MAILSVVSADVTVASVVQTVLLCLQIETLSKTAHGTVQIGVCATVPVCVWEIKDAGVPLFSYWHWEALAGSAIWHILAHRRL